MYTRMRIINSHYIPLPAPYRLIMSSKSDEIAVQIGVLSVVEEQPSSDGGYGIVTHEHPVVKSVGHTAYISEEDESLETFYSLSKADGSVWSDEEVGDCIMLCSADKRSINLLLFNLLLSSSLASKHGDYDPIGLLRRLKEYGISLELTENAKRDRQEIVLVPIEVGRKMYLKSYEAQLPFAVAFADCVGEGMMKPYDMNEVFFEFVNQARMLLTFNRNYDFKFMVLDHRQDDLTERLNTELNNYLEREDESE